MAAGGAGRRVGGGLGGRERQPQFVQALGALLPLDLLLHPLLVRLLAGRAAVAATHADLQAPTQNLVHETVQRSRLRHAAVTQTTDILLLTFTSSRLRSTFSLCSGFAWPPWLSCLEPKECEALQELRGERGPEVCVKGKSG